MGLVDFLSRKPKVGKIRHGYDKLRERVDKLPKIEKRIELLRMLDQIEPQVAMMEEHHMSTFEMKKTAEYINHNIKRVELLIQEEKSNEKRKNNQNRGGSESTTSTR